MARGQTALEFIIVMAFAMISGGVLLLGAASMLIDTSEQQRIAALNDVGYGIQDEIILATTVNDGYSRTFRVPERADRFQYTLTSTPTAVILRSGPTTITYSHPLIAGTIAQGTNTILKDGTVTVT